MKVASLSSFISYELNSEEDLLAYEFTDIQVAGIQNLLAAAAEDLIKVALEAADLSLDGAKKLAYTKGQIDSLKHLLVMADVIKERREAEKLAAEQN